MQKVRNQPLPCGHRPLPACRHTISGSLDSPHRGSFHLSLAVLVHYRSTGSIQAYEMVLADSGRIARVPPYLGTPLSQTPVSATGLSPSMARLSRQLAYKGLILNAVPQPRLFSSPRGTEMFHFPRFARSLLLIQSDVRRHYPPWVSPFGHRRIKAWLAAPRRFSQLPTSFFASCRLGIHRVPFVAWSSLFFFYPNPSIQEDQGPAHSQPARLKTGRYFAPAFSLYTYLRICNCQRTMEETLVEPIGIEPTTSSLQSWRSPS
jgi:hypothetical protein